MRQIVSGILAVNLIWGTLACSDQTTSNTQTQLTPELAKGKDIVDNNCVVCHSQAINGAPILGNKKMWGERINQGIEVLSDHAINGFAGMMPPKGGNTDLSDDEVRLAVKYMVSLVEGQ